VGDVKLMILGNGRVGKTQICRRLRGESFDEAVPSTHGIQVSSLSLAPVFDAPGPLKIWDFGGQDMDACAVPEELDPGRLNDMACRVSNQCRSARSGAGEFLGAVPKDRAFVGYRLAETCVHGGPVVLSTNEPAQTPTDGLVPTGPLG
jgi:hypothetical protein